MYKMLVVDDNRFDRTGIEKILDWRSMDIEIIGSCSNGLRALEAIEQAVPDIILTDVAMPLMNGIELSQKIKQEHPNIKIIFMSCHSDFTYAKTAIFLDIQDYVLKPIKREELQNAVLKAINKQKNEDELQKQKEEMLSYLNDSLPALQNQFIRELLFGNYCDDADIANQMSFLKMSFPEKCPIWVLRLDIGRYEKADQQPDIDKLYYIIYTMRKIIESVNSREEFVIHLVQISNKELALLVLAVNNLEHASTRFMDMVVNIHDEIVERHGLTVTIGISKCACNICEIPVLYNQACQAVKTKYYSEQYRIISYDEIEGLMDGSPDEIVDARILYKEIGELLSYSSLEDIKAFVGKYLKQKKAIYSDNHIRSFIFSVVFTIQLILLENDESVKNISEDELTLWRKLEHFHTIADIENWVCNIIFSAKTCLESSNKTREGKIVEEIKEIIAKRYMEQLPVKDMIGSVYLSPNHASALFKKVTGKTIFDYLTEYRVEEAKKLLKDPYCKVYLVAEQVGYTNKSHFTHVFKKYTKLTPLEYKDKAIL